LERSMKRYQHRPALYLALLLGSATAFAQTSAPPSVSPSVPPDAAQMRATVSDRFAAADVNHDNKLTREEAVAKMPGVARNFDRIDKTKKGYVTLEDVEAYAKERSTQRHAAQPATTN